MGKPGRENRRELVRLDWKMGQLGWQSFTGMKGMAREEKRLRSRNTWSRRR